MVPDAAACKGVVVKCGRADLPHCFFMEIYRGIGRCPSVFRKGRIAFGAFFGMSVRRSIGGAFDTFPSRNSSRCHLFSRGMLRAACRAGNGFLEVVGSLSGSFFGASVCRSIGVVFDTFPSRNSAQCHLFCEGCCVPRVGPETVFWKLSVLFSEVFSERRYAGRLGRRSTAFRLGIRRGVTSFARDVACRVSGRKRFPERRRFAFISGGVAGNCRKSLKDCDIGLSSGKSLGIRNLLRTFEN